MELVQREQYNILVLGETGAGKSTFINGLLNYFSFESFKEAQTASHGKYCIPTIFDWNGEHCIIIGRNEDEDEYQEIGKSATQNVGSYLFEFGNIGIRIIDTPGFGDTGGREKDEEICEKLLNFLSTRNDLVELHGIIFVFSPHNRKTTFFTYCIEQIFSKLHRDATQNIIFVFTHTKANNYKPGPTAALIKDVLKDIENGNIKCKKENMFCIENDCIKFLLALFYNTENLTFDDVEREDYIRPWDKSSEECIRLINYVKTLKPHSVKDTVFLNSVRNYIVKLNNHLPSILTKIEKHIAACEEYRNQIKACSGDLIALDAVLYKKTYTKRGGNKYFFVCRNSKCSLKETHGKNKEACCQSLIASYTLVWPFRSKCRFCGCNKLDHIFESDENYGNIKEELNKNIVEDISEKQKIKNCQNIALFGLQLDIKKYTAESKYIEYWIEKLSKYLEKISILSDQRRFGGTDSITEEKISIEDLQKNLTGLEMTGKDVKEILIKEDISVSLEKIYYIQEIPNNWKRTLGNV